MKLVPIFFIIIMTSNLIAGPVDGLEKEFSQVEEFYKNDTPSDEDKKRLLEKNIMSAVKITLIKRYENTDSYLKDLNPDKLQYQFMAETFSLYVKFNDFYLFYKFYKDPRMYYQTPIFEKFYTKPANLTSTTHEPAKNEAKTGKK